MLNSTSKQKIYVNNLLPVLKQQVINGWLADLNSKLKDKEIFIKKEELNTMGFSINDIRKILNVNVVIQTRFYDFELEEWVGEKGFWISKKLLTN